MMFQPFLHKIQLALSSLQHFFVSNKITRKVPNFYLRVKIYSYAKNMLKDFIIYELITRTAYGSS